MERDDRGRPLKSRLRRSVWEAWTRNGRRSPIRAPRHTREIHDAIETAVRVGFEVIRGGVVEPATVLGQVPESVAVTGVQTHRDRASESAGFNCGRVRVPVVEITEHADLRRRILDLRDREGHQDGASRLGGAGGDHATQSTPRFRLGIP